MRRVLSLVGPEAMISPGSVFVSGGNMGGKTREEESPEST